MPVRFSLAMLGPAICVLPFLSLAASAQELPEDTSDSKPVSGGLSDTTPTFTPAPATSKRIQRTARTSEIGGTEVGQRLERKDLIPNGEPLQRINSRIENRVENRINNRIDRKQDTDTDSTAAYAIATARVRAATQPSSGKSQTP